MRQKMCDSFSEFPWIWVETEGMSKCCEECEEISMWNLYKFMSFESFAAKCKYYERETKFLPVTSQVKVDVLK